MSKTDTLATLFEAGQIHAAPATPHYGEFVHANDGLPHDKNIQREPPDTRFLNTVRIHGTVMPIIVIKFRKDGTYKLLAGRKRTLAARVLGLEDPRHFVLPVIWYWDDELTRAEVFSLQTLENRARSDNAMTDTVAVRQLQRMDLAGEEIQALTGLHSATLKAFEKYDKLSGVWEDAWLWLQTIDTPIADQLVRCTKEEQEKLYKIYLAQQNRITLALVTDLINARPKPAATIKVDKKATWQEVVQEALAALLADVVPADWKLDKIVSGAFNTLTLAVRASVTRAPKAPAPAKKTKTT